MGNSSPSLWLPGSGKGVGSMDSFESPYNLLQQDETESFGYSNVDDTTTLDDVGNGGGGAVIKPSVFEISEMDDNCTPGGVSFMQYMGASTRGLLLHYWAIGFAFGFIRNPMSYYYVSVRNVEADYLNVVATFLSLPYAFKVVFGILSDTFPIFHYRRKSYMYLGWSIFSICFLILMKIEILNFNFATLLLFISSWGLIMADVSADALVVEWSKFEQEAFRGKLQLYTYILRFTGGMVGVALGSSICDVTNTRGFGLTIGQTCLLHGLQPIIIVFPYLIQLAEGPVRFRSERILMELRNKLHQIFECVSYRAVHVPLLYIVLQHMAYVSNAAWYSFLVNGLGFTIFQTGLLGLIAAITGTLSLIMYGYCLEGVSWRHIFVGATSMSVFFNAANALLILRTNKILGVPDFVFAAGDDVMMDVISSLFTVPTFRMMNLMCPKGSEGVAYATLTSAANLGYTVASSVGTTLTNIWDVSNIAMKEQRFDGIFKLHCLTSLLPLLPLPLVVLIPRNTKDQLSAMEQKIKNYHCGVMVLVCILAGIIFTVSTAVYVFEHTPPFGNQ